MKKIGNVKLVREDICRNVHLKEDEKMKQVRQVTLVHLAKQVSFLTTELKQKDEELEEKNRVRTDLDSTLTVAINNSNAKEAIIQSLTKQVDSYALELKEVKDTLKAVSLQKETVDEMLKKTTSEFQEANTKIHELHVQYENACDEKMSASELFEKSQREQADLVASVASLRASLNERDLELAELRPQLVATKLDASESKQQLLMTLAELECAKMEVLSYEKNIPEEIQRLLGDLQRTSTELEQSKESVAALRSELDVMSAQDQAALSNQREESEFKIKSIQGRFDGVVIEKEKLMDQVLLLKLALDQMTLAANDSQLNLERTKLDLQSAVTVMKDMESSRDDTYTDMQVLQTDLYKARSELEQSENSIKLLREELEVVTANSQAALALQQDKFETDVEKLHSLMNELRADRDEAIGALDQSKQELVDCISRIDSLTIRQSETEQESQNALENARASSEKQICQILDELANVQSQHLQLIADSTIKDQQLLSYETQVISMTKSTTAHLSKIDELKALSISTNSQFKIQLQDVGLLLAQAQATIQLLKNSNSLLDQEAKSLRSSEASLVQQVENLQSMLDEKEIQLAASAMNAMKKTVDVNFLSKDITEYRENGAHAQAQMRNCAASYSAQIASLMGQVGAQRSQLIAQTQLIESMKVETSEFDTRYRELVKDFEGDFEAMEKEMKGVIATNTVLDEKVLELQAKLTSSSSEFHSTKVTVKKLEDSLREAEIKIAAQEVIAEKTEKLESSLREAETKVAEQEVKSVTMKNLDDSLREAETKVAEHQENTAVKIKHLEDSLKEAETKVAELEVLLSITKSEYQDTDAKLKGLDDRVKYLDTIFIEQEQLNDTLSCSVKSLHDVVTTSRASQENSEIAYQVLMEAHVKTEALLTRLREQLQRKNEELEEVCLKFESVNKILIRFEKQDRKRQTASDEREGEVKSLREKVAYLTKRTRDLESKCLQQENEIIDLRMMLLTQEAEYKLSTDIQSMSQCDSSESKGLLRPYCLEYQPNLEEATNQVRPEMCVQSQYALSEQGQVASHPFQVENRETQVEGESLDDDIPEAIIDPFELHTNDRKVPTRALGARMLCSFIERRDTAALSKAFHRWATKATEIKSLSQKAQVAHLMANQLETTREKLSRLKAHLRYSQTHGGHQPRSLVG